jgi:hypothetical protein
MVELPDPGAAMEAGLKPTVTPDGWPDADKATAASKPSETVVVIVDVAELPSATVTELGDAEMAKLGEDATPVSALISPVPFGLPHPVTKS